MCGITGFWGNEAGEFESRAMTDPIRHRGPDGQGHFFDPAAGLVLGHRRLSVIDVSEAGQQPMTSPCGRYTLAFNGEIYNFGDIRAELEAVGGHFRWRGHSDTEVLLAALRHWGLVATLERLNGMFAFALWDATDHTLALARDRLGEKPLYYTRMGGTFAFASELKALSASPSWRGRVDRAALTQFLRHNYVPGPLSIFEDVYKLPAGHYLMVRERGASTSKPEAYWSLEAAAAEPRTDAGTDQEWIERLDNLLSDAVGRRMVADVPLGAFLSGGFDSSAVVALMQKQSDRPVRTFSIGFEEAGYNEAHHARAVADHLQTDHTELYVTPEDALRLIPELPTIWDEPFADSSQLPTLLVSRLARRDVTVALSGDGGDELFCGYGRYPVASAIWRRISLLPRPVRARLGRLLEGLPPGPVNALSRVLPGRVRPGHLGDRLPKLGGLIGETSSEHFYRRLISHWRNPLQVVIDGSEPDTPFDSLPERLGGLSFEERMMFLDTLTYLPDDILTKVDRATMSVSLEARVPLLDHRVVEFAWATPMHLKSRAGVGKWILRQVLYRYVPRQLLDRPKMGFGVPIEHWLRGPLREWADALLDPLRLREEGYFEPEPIARLWKEHLSGVRRWHAPLWDVLMFQAWHEHWRSQAIGSVEPDARLAVRAR